MINIIYKIIDMTLPFEFMKPIFMKNAFLAFLFISPVLGLLGTMVVNNKMSFFSDALGHSALCGLGIGAVFGLNEPLPAMLIFSVIFSLLIIWIKDRNNSSMDTIIGVFSSTGIALGLILMYKSKGLSKFTNYLAGDILSVRTQDLAILFAVFIIVIVLWVFIFNKLLIVSLNQTFAISRGINTKLLEIIFTVIIAIVVTVSIKSIGILIINSLLVLPAAASRNISRTMRQYSFLSVAISVVCGLSGLIISYFWNTPSGATMVLLSAIVYFATLFIKEVRH